LNEQCLSKIRILQAGSFQIHISGHQAAGLAAAHIRTPQQGAVGSRGLQDGLA
jgi:hypothetical protein